MHISNGIRVAGNWSGYKSCTARGCKEPGTHFVVAEGKYVFSLYCEKDANEMSITNASWITAVLPRAELEE